MKPITFSVNSWHYKMVDKVIGLPRGYFNEDLPMDLCTYFRKLMLCLFMLTVAAAFIIGLVIIPLADLSAWVLAGLITGWTDTLGVGGVIIGEAIIAVLFGIAAGIVFSLEALKKRKQANRLKNREAREAGVPEPTPSIMVELYRKFKDKTCVRIEFK